MCYQRGDLQARDDDAKCLDTTACSFCSGNDLLEDSGLNTPQSLGLFLSDGKVQLCAAYTSLWKLLVFKLMNSFMSYVLVVQFLTFKSRYRQCRMLPYYHRSASFMGFSA